MKFKTVIAAVSLLTAAACDAASNIEATPEAPVQALEAPTLELGYDAPELALRGPHAIGVTSISVTLPDQPDIGSYEFTMAEMPLYDRTLPVDIFYPIDPETTGDRAIYIGRLFNPPEAPIEGLPETFDIQGTALRDAAAQSGATYPLVLVSHGFGNTPGTLSRITEHLASQGYIVAVIDHGDFEPASSSYPLAGFGRVMYFRSIDQQAVLAHLVSAAVSGDADWATLIDTDAIGLMGYSMGGYGALNHVGAGFDANSGPYNWVGGAALQALSEGSPEFEQRSIEIDAVAAIAPWGAQAGVDIWRNEAFANITTPLLLVVGSEDDVVGYETSVQEIFDSAVNTDRYMLVFQNALHNLVQIPAPAEAKFDIRVWESFEDPTWKKNRLLYVNNHFLTAFFDWQLKGLDARRAYLDVPTVVSNDGDWPQPMGAYYGDQFADGSSGSAGYWKGFKRRQALGLEMHHRAGPSEDGE